LTQMIVPPLVDVVAFANAPLVLVLPIAGLSIVLASLIATSGFCGAPREMLTTGEIAAIGLIVAGVVVTSVFGPTEDIIGTDVAKLTERFLCPEFIVVAVLFGGFSIGWAAYTERLCVRETGCDAACASTTREHALTHTFLSALAASCAAALTMLFLKGAALIIPCTINKGRIPWEETIIFVCLMCTVVFAALQIVLPRGSHTGRRTHCHRIRRSVRTDESILCASVCAAGAHQRVDSLG